MNYLTVIRVVSIRLKRKMIEEREREYSHIMTNVYSEPDIYFIILK